MALARYTILAGGGLMTGGFNFDDKLRCQSVDPAELLITHMGGRDTLALALIKAAELIEQSMLEPFIAERYVSLRLPGRGRNRVAHLVSVKMH